jgi:hypothetical protein
MTLSDQFSDDPPVRGNGPKPTDTHLPIRRRTVSGPYLVAILVVVAIGVALVAFGMLRTTQSGSRIEATPGALAPTEQIVPATEDSSSLRDDGAESTAPASSAPQIESRPGAADVPGGG